MARKKPAKTVRTTVIFRDKAGNVLANVSVEGPPDLQDPKKILQLMDLLNLPEGVEAEVLATAASVIVR